MPLRLLAKGTETNIDTKLLPCGYNYLYTWVQARAEGAMCHHCQFHRRSSTVNTHIRLRIQVVFIFTNPEIVTVTSPPCC